MSGMEPEVSNYLKKIAQSISAILIWMLVIILVGLKWEYLFWGDGHNLGTSLFYLYLAVSAFLLVRWLIRSWKQPFS
jgi:hypothetical protein